MVCAGVPDQMVDAVTLLRDRAENDEANVLYSLVNDLSKVQCWAWGFFPPDICCCFVLTTAFVVLISSYLASIVHQLPLNLKATLKSHCIYHDIILD